MNRRQWMIVLGLLVLVALFFALDLGRFLSLDAIKQRQADLAALYDTRPALVIAAFFAVYVAVTALSLPALFQVTVLLGAEYFL